MPPQISHPITLIAQITNRLVRTVFKTAFRRNLLLVSGLVAVAVTVLYFGRPVRAANIEWSGAGADNNWSTGANWLGGVAPGSGDVAVFVGGSLNQNKDATIDVSFNVAGIQINSTYGGFINQTSGTTLTIGNFGYVQNGASGFSINAAGTVNLSFDLFQVTGGTFNAGGGTRLPS